MSATQPKKKGRSVLMLGGGAPNFPLMAGALLAFHEAGIRFDLISMTGAGSVLGLIYLSPKGLSQADALRNAVNYGIADTIYSMLPVNYKMFQKGGYAADQFRAWCDAQPYLQQISNQLNMSDADKLRSDAIQALLAAACPSDLSPYSTGLCAHAPFIEHVVDFANLKNSPTDCVMNAYCIEDRKVQQWRREEIDIHRFRASLSFPLIYSPYRVAGKHYYEGAGYEALNLGGIGLSEDPNSLSLFPDNDPGPQHLDEIVVFNIMTPELIKRPSNLWDAYGQSIIYPLVANAQNEEKFLTVWEQYGYLFSPLRDVDTKNPKAEHKPLIDAVNLLLKKANAALPKDVPHMSFDALREKLPPHIHRVKFDIPADHEATTLEWRSSNLTYLFDLGYETGHAYAATTLDHLK